MNKQIACLCFLLIIIIATLLLRIYRLGVKSAFELKGFLNKRKILRGIITLIVLAVFLIVIGSLSYYYNRDDLNKEKAEFDSRKRFTTATVISFKMRGFKAVAADYTYTYDVKNKIYSGDFQALSGSDAFLDKKFLVAYDSINPQNNYILVFPRNFQELGLTFPDSLRWVIQYN